jgi:hypothetical protein
LGRLSKYIQVIIGVVTCLCVYRVSGQISKEQLSEFKKVIPIETVVIHTNKKVFLAGETLFYKFYSLSKTNKPSDVSKIGYVKLIGNGKTRLFEHKLKLESGVAGGDFFVPANIETGQYKLVAYTKWMENNSRQPIFIKDIYVVNPFTISNNYFGEDKDTDKNTVFINKVEDFIIDSKKELGKINLGKKSYFTRSKVTIGLKSAFANIDSGNYSLSIKKIDSLSINENISFNKSLERGKEFYLPEIGSEILSGKVLDINNNTPVPNKIVTLTIPGRDYVFKNVKTNNEGAFYFTLYENYRDTDALVQIQDVDRNQYKVILDSKPFLYDDNLTFRSVKLSDSIKPWLLNQSVYKQVENAYANVKKDSIVYKPTNKLFYGEASLTYVLDDFKRFPTVRETFVEVIQKAAIRETKDSYKFKVNDFLDFKNSAFKDYDPLVLVDGYLIQNNADLVEYDCEKIESISIVRGIYFCGPMIYNGILDVKTKNLSFNLFHNNTDIIKFNLDTPQEQKIYFKPIYNRDNKALERIPDYRTQLLWVPNIELGKANNEVEFYTSDITGNFEVVLEGYSILGEYIKSSCIITVKD